MAIEIRTIEKVIPANAKDEEIGVLIPREREKITVLEIAFKLAAAGKIRAAVRGTDVVEVTDFTAPSPDMRVLQELELLAGDDYRFFGTDESGAANRMSILLVIKREVA